MRKRTVPLSFVAAPAVAAQSEPTRVLHQPAAATHADAARGHGVYAAAGARGRALGLGASVAGALVVLSLVHGGFAPAAWGWTALGGLWVSVLAFAFRSAFTIDRAGVAFLGGLIAFAGWTAVSTTWSQSVPRTMLEVERDLVYVAVIAALLLLSRAADTPVLLAGLGGGLAVVVLYAFARYLATAPAPDITQGYLLSSPLGYANAVGGLVAIAIPLIFAFATRESRPGVRAAAGASIVVLSVALYLTQNRAGYLAVGVALAVWLLRTEARSRTAAVVLVLAVPAALAVAAVSRVDLLDVHRRAGDSRRVAAAAIVVALAALAALLARRMTRLRMPRRWAARGAWGAAVLVGAALVTALLASGNRGAYWGVAWRAFAAHPFLGTGGGTFDEQWLRYRPSGVTVHDAHSLYTETASELGVVGLLILVALLASPIVVSRRTRDPLVTACLASYCGFIVHAGFEWDWEMPVVTISGLVLALVLVRSRESGPLLTLARPARFAGGAVAAGLAAFALVALVGNTSVVGAERAIAVGDLRTANARATRARQLLPWASEPWLVIADVRARSLDLEGSRAALRAAIARDRRDWSLWLRFAAASRGSRRADALRHAFALNPRLVSGVGRKS